MKKDKRTDTGKSHPSNSEAQRNRQQQVVDKAPGEERGKGEKGNQQDLKGKKVDADPSQKSGRPK